MKKKNLISRLRMPLPQLEQYYRIKRGEDLQAGTKLGGVGLRKCFCPVFRAALFVERIFFRRQTITVLHREKYRGSYIYACTHIGENDLENIYESIGAPAWWFVGDPGFMYKDFSGLMVWLNGGIFADTPHRDDCHVAYDRSVELLKRGGSLMIFPEGARNGFCSLPVMKLFSGTARMSKETGVKIIPVAAEQYGQHFVLEFAEALDPKDYPDAGALSDALRDAMAGAKWRIWEHEGIGRRSEIPEHYEEAFRADFERKISLYDTPETIERARFHSPEDLEMAAVERDLRRLAPGNGGQGW